MENTQHQEITATLWHQVFFAHLYSSWECGTNENINSLIRKHLPTSNDFSKITQYQISHPTYLINTRQRKYRNFKTHNEVLSPSVATSMLNVPHLYDKFFNTFQVKAIMNNVYITFRKSFDKSGACKSSFGVFQK